VSTSGRRRHALANQYAAGAAFLLQKTGWQAPAAGIPGSTSTPLDVIAWYHLFLAVRSGRALVAAARADRGIPGEREDAEAPRRSRLSASIAHAQRWDGLRAPRRAESAGTWPRYSPPSPPDSKREFPGHGPSFVSESTRRSYDAT